MPKEKMLKITQLNPPNSLMNQIAVGADRRETGPGGLGLGYAPEQSDPKNEPRPIRSGLLKDILSLKPKKRTTVFFDFEIPE
jgi:hypothetical protein